MRRLRPYARRMLVLTRRAGESIVIGEDVVVTVVEVRGDVVRLGIAAPRSVQVHREEVFRAVGEANRAAASASDADVERLASGLRAGRPAAPPAAGEGASGQAATTPAPPASTQPTSGTPKPGPRQP